MTEGELGVLAGVEDEVSSEHSNYTQPDEVQDFVKKTGVDALAISIGTSHGRTKFKPEQCTKTAEGKMQAIVLAAIPFVLLFALHMVDDQWLKPLFETSIGWIVLTIATMFWAAAILLARRILTVDI